MPYRRTTTAVGLGDDYETVTVDTSITTLTAAKAARADRLFITIEGGNALFRYDGGDPDVATDKGHLAADGDSLTIYGTQNFQNLKIVATTATDSIWKVTYEV